MVGLLHPSTLRSTQTRAAAELIDLNAGVSESHRKKKKENSKSEKKDKAHKGKFHGSVSTDPVPVLVDSPLPQLLEHSVVPEAVGGPISITAISVALSTDDSDNGDGDSEKKKHKEKKKGELGTTAVPVLEKAQQGLHAVKEEKNIQ